MQRLIKKTVKVSWFTVFCMFSRLAAKLKEAQDKKEKIEDEIKTKQDYLDTLQPKLNTILQV